MKLTEHYTQAIDILLEYVIKTGLKAGDMITDWSHEHNGSMVWISGVHMAQASLENFVRAEPGTFGHVDYYATDRLCDLAYRNWAQRFGVNFKMSWDDEICFSGPEQNLMNLMASIGLANKIWEYNSTDTATIPNGWYLDVEKQSRISGPYHDGIHIMSLGFKAWRRRLAMQAL